jgi:hypothetical protein
MATALKGARHRGPGKKRPRAGGLQDKGPPVLSVPALIPLREHHDHEDPLTPEETEKGPNQDEGRVGKKDAGGG